MKWTTENINKNQSSFLCTKDKFIDYLKFSTPFLGGAIKHLGAKPSIINKEVAYQNLPFLKKYANSKILIVGSGPSLSEFEVKQEEYDFIWSCNYFYKNEKMKKIKISLVSLGNEVDLFDKELVEYLCENETEICFENKYTKVEEMGKYKKMFKDKVFWALTRYHSRIGSVQRLACIAIFLGVKDISFIGMDGYYSYEKTQNDYPNAFRPYIKPTGTIEDNNKTDSVRQKLYNQQYLTFWDYLLHDIGKDVKFHNLGHNHVCNNTTKVLHGKLGKNYQDYLTQDNSGRMLYEKR
jgi:hypothetical protein